MSEIIEGPRGPLKIDLSKNEFENSIDTYLEKIKMLMEEALDRANCKPNNINQILLVGGKLYPYSYNFRNYKKNNEKISYKRSECR